MTPAETADFLRQFNEWRRSDYEPSEQPAPPNSREISEAIDAAVEILDRLEAAERDNALKEEVIDSLAVVIKKLETETSAELEAAERERDELRAKIERMERQEPVSFALYSGWALKDTYRKEHEACEQRDRRQLTADLSGSLEAYRVEPLYALPGAKGE